MNNFLDDDLDGLFEGAAAPRPGVDLANDPLLNASVARAASQTFAPRPRTDSSMPASTCGSSPLSMNCCVLKLSASPRFTVDRPSNAPTPSQVWPS